MNTTNFYEIINQMKKKISKNEQFNMNNEIISYELLCSQMYNKLNPKDYNRIGNIIKKIYYKNNQQVNIKTLVNIINQLLEFTCCQDTKTKKFIINFNESIIK